MHRYPHFLLLLLLSAALPAQECAQLAVARRFLGRPYVANTLEVNAPDEQLVVDTLHVDCTTFVDQVLALALTENATGQSCISADSTFRSLLTRIRYHDGIIDGYASRCHYFTDMADNMATQGLLLPVKSRGMVTRSITLHFMSSHPDSYIQLRSDTVEQTFIRRAESRLGTVRQHYIPKEQKSAFRRSTSYIRDGDVLALVSNIDGLDVSHLGFAVWVGEELHLLNASSRQGCVVLDDQPLRSYLLTRSSCPGIEVWRPYISNGFSSSSNLQK